MTNEELIKAYVVDQKTMSEIERLSGISRPTLRKRLLGAGVTIRSQKETRALQKDNKFDCPDIDKLHSMVSEGSSKRKLMQHFGTYQGQIERWLADAGLSVSRSKYEQKTIPPKGELQLLIDESKTYDEICNHFEISYPTLMKWLIGYDIVREDETKYKVMSDAIKERNVEKAILGILPKVSIKKSSRGEEALFSFVNSIGGDFRKRNIYLDNGARRELDMYDESRKLAIEYSGAYYHSEAHGKDNRYHYDKWKYCRDRNIDLLTFWDLEVENRTPQVQSFIKARMGIFDERVYARDLEFKELSIKQYEFFENNHIQGRAAINRNFALMDGNRIMGCVSFAKHHRDSSKYTLNRLAFESGVQIVGGVGKLLKNALAAIDVPEIITWSDNRFSNGKIYEKNGFQFDELLKPDYIYYDRNGKKLVSKQSQQKNKIGCPEGMTEREFCMERNLYRLWDCGKIRWIYRNPGKKKPGD